MKDFKFYIRKNYIGAMVEYGNITIQLDSGTIDMKRAKVIKSDGIEVIYEFESANIDFLNKTITIGE